MPSVVEVPTLGEPVNPAVELLADLGHLVGVLALGALVDRGAHPSEQAVDFVIDCIARMLGGEVFVPKIPSMRVTDIADALAPEATRKVIGIRPGEKIHEVLLTAEEARHATSYDDYFAIYPSFPFWRTEPYPEGDELAPGFSYSSDSNTQWLTFEQIRAMAEQHASVG